MNEVVTDSEILSHQLISDTSAIDNNIAATTGTEEGPPKRQAKAPREGLKPSRKRSTSKRNDSAIVETTKKHCNISGMLGMHMCVCVYTLLVLVTRLAMGPQISG